MKMNTMNTISLKAPKITPAQRKELEVHKRDIEEVIRDGESGSRNVRELQNKESSLEKSAASLHCAASQFDRDAEIKLAATLKQIERVHLAIRQEESSVRGEREVNFRIVDQAQELVQKLCQVTYHELEEQIISALAPYYGPRLDEARYGARNSPAMTSMNSLLTHGLIGAESSERIVGAAVEMLRKIDALLTGTEIWQYDGGEAALEPTAA
jgi:hypothetical protein